MRAERLKHLGAAVLGANRRTAARGDGTGRGGRHAWKRPEGSPTRSRPTRALIAPSRRAHAHAPGLRNGRRGSVVAGCVVRTERAEAEAPAHFTRGDPARSGARSGVEAAGLQEGWGAVGFPRGRSARRRTRPRAQKKADKHWKPLLTKWRGWLGDKTKRTRPSRRSWSSAIACAAGRSLVGLRRRQFGPPRPGGSGILGQIDAPAASRARVPQYLRDPRPKSAAGPPRRSGKQPRPPRVRRFLGRPSAPASRSSTRSGHRRAWISGVAVRRRAAVVQRPADGYAPPGVALDRVRAERPHHLDDITGHRVVSARHSPKRRQRRDFFPPPA